MADESDVLVIGAGPAGTAAAIEAARAGLGVCLVDRARFPRPKTCGDAVSNSAAALIAELGAGEALSAAPQAVVRGAAAIFPDQSRVERSYGARPGYIVTRFALDDVLRREAEHAGARVVEGVQVRSLVVHDGRVAGARGDRFEWRARAVVAADGPGSVAWTALGARPPRGRALGLAITAYYSRLRPAAHDGVSEHYFDRELCSGYGWIFPEVEGVANVGVYLRADRYRATGLALDRLLENFIARHPERFVGGKREGRTRSWQLPLATARRAPVAPGLLSCGDAALLIDPLTGEGIWHALESGRLAGQAAARALAHGELDRAAVFRYRREIARRLTWPTATRRTIERGIESIVRRDLYRYRAVRALLTWGYGRSSFELSKSVS
jgi:menaquinone-9 beta-reductase